MPPKRARVSAECAIANIMRFMEHYDNNDSVTVMIVKSVMLKMIWIVYMGRPVSFSCIYLSIFQYSKPLRMRIISWGQQNIHVTNPKKKLIIINYLKLR